jgi:hypothetical protein
MKRLKTTTKTQKKLIQYKKINPYNVFQPFTNKKRLSIQNTL